MGGFGANPQRAGTIGDELGFDLICVRPLAPDEARLGWNGAGYA
jgi:hypothetical protein